MIVFIEMFQFELVYYVNQIPTEELCNCTSEVKSLIDRNFDFLLTIFVLSAIHSVASAVSSKYAADAERKEAEQQAQKQKQALPAEPDAKIADDVDVEADHPKGKQFKPHKVSTDHSKDRMEFSAEMMDIFANVFVGTGPSPGIFWTRQ